MLRNKVKCGHVLIATMVAVFATLALMGPSGAAAAEGKATAAAKAAAKKELTAAKAAVLGVVEGLTEYLPISSSGHLLVAERLMHVGDKKLTKDAADTYTIVIQAGAIFAVLLIFWKRILDVLQGLIGRSAEGRRLLIVLILGFLPAAVAGVAGESKIKAKLLEPVPVAIAWTLGAIAILVIGSKLHQRGKTQGRLIGEITNRDALIIGCAQVLALWPGTSRSLVTILAALMLGLSLSTAVEFSFLLGLLTLSAATAKDMISGGKQMVDTYGAVNPTIGFLVAFAVAFIAVKWMIGYLQKNSLNVFAYYRLAAAAVAIALFAADKI